MIKHKNTKGTANRVLAFALSACLLHAQGCSGRGSIDSHFGSAPTYSFTGTVDTVGGYDVTESFVLHVEAQAFFKGLLTQLRPGDTFYLRAISSRSYSDSERTALGSVVIPELPARPKNPFDTRRKRAWQMAVGSLAEELDRLIDLTETVPTDHKGTDIWGFLAKAQELLASSHAAIKLIVIASDLGDNVHRRPELRLDGITAVIIMLQSSGDNDPRVTRKLRQEWAHALQKLGALNVVFVDPSQAHTFWLRQAVGNLNQTTPGGK